MKHINTCNLYIGGWLLYYLQGPLSIQGSVIMQLLLVGLLSVSFYYVYYALLKYKVPSYLKATNLLLLLFTLYGGYQILFGGKVTAHGSSMDVINNFEFLKAIYSSLLPIYPMYVFGRKGLLTERLIRSWALIFFIVATVSFFYEEYQSKMTALLKGGTNEEVTNNSGYIFLSLLPITCFFKDKIWFQLLLLVYIVIFLIMGMKRGAILIGSICLIVNFVYFYKNSRNRVKIKLLLTFSLLLIIGAYFFSSYIDNSPYFSERVAETLEGDSSGRDDIYSRYFNYFFDDASLLSFLWGYGADGTLKIFGQYAHNDWLEILINHGISGILLFGAFWVSFYKDWRKTKKKSITRIALVLVLIISFMKTLFSMSYNDMRIYDTIIIGFCLSQLEFKKKLIKKY